MSDINVQQVYDTLDALLAAGKEDEARDYLNEVLPDLPDDLRQKIMLDMFIDTMKEEANAREAIAQIQEEGVTAIKALQEIQKKSEQEDAPAS